MSNPSISTVDCVQFPKYKDFDVKVTLHQRCTHFGHSAPKRNAVRNADQKADQALKDVQLEGNWQLPVIAKLSSCLNKAFNDPTWWSPYWKVVLYNPSLKTTVIRILHTTLNQSSGRHCIHQPGKPWSDHPWCGILRSSLCKLYDPGISCSNIPIISKHEAMLPASQT